VRARRTSARPHGRLSTTSTQRVVDITFASNARHRLERRQASIPPLRHIFVAGFLDHLPPTRPPPRAKHSLELRGFPTRRHPRLPGGRLVDHLLLPSTATDNKRRDRHRKPSPSTINGTTMPDRERDAASALHRAGECERAVNLSQPARQLQRHRRQRRRRPHLSAVETRQSPGARHHSIALAATGRRFLTTATQRRRPGPPRPELPVNDHLDFLAARESITFSLTSHRDDNNARDRHDNAPSHYQRHTIADRASRRRPRPFHRGGDASAQDLQPGRHCRFNDNRRQRRRRHHLASSRHRLEAAGSIDPPIDPAGRHAVARFLEPRHQLPQSRPGHHALELLAVNDATSTSWRPASRSPSPTRSRRPTITPDRHRKTVTIHQLAPTMRRP